MSRTQMAIVSLALAAPIAVFVGCSGDDPVAPAGPQNKLDSGLLADTSVTSPDAPVPPVDAGVDSAPNVCASGIVFDNATRIPGWPSVPQP